MRRFHHGVNTPWTTRHKLEQKTSRTPRVRFSRGLNCPRLCQKNFATNCPGIIFTMSTPAGRRGRRAGRVANCGAALQSAAKSLVEIETLFHIRIIETDRETPLGCSGRVRSNGAGVLQNSENPALLLAFRPKTALFRTHLWRSPLNFNGLTKWLQR
jgi:hypothetical protein